MNCAAVQGPIKEGTRATIEMHHVFSEVPQFGSLRPLPKTDLENNIIATGLKIPWPKHTRRFMQRKWAISDDFGLRSPVIQKPFSPKKGIPLL